MMGYFHAMGVRPSIFAILIITTRMLVLTSPDVKVLIT